MRVVGVEVTAMVADVLVGALESLFSVVLVPKLNPVLAGVVED